MSAQTRPDTPAPAQNPGPDPELLVLAEQLDQLRIMANTIEKTAPQDGVYGDVSRALQKVIALLTEDAARAEQVYETLLSTGSTVTEAIESEVLP